MSRCADFNSWNSGASSYANHGVSANLNITGSLSMDAWVRLRQTSKDQRSFLYIRAGVGGAHTVDLILASVLGVK